MLKYSLSAITKKNKGLQFKPSHPSRYGLGRGGLVVKGQVQIFSSVSQNTPDICTYVQLNSFAHCSCSSGLHQPQQRSSHTHLWHLNEARCHINTWLYTMSVRLALTVYVQNITRGYRCKWRILKGFLFSVYTQMYRQLSLDYFDTEENFKTWWFPGKLLCYREHRFQQAR